MNSDKRRTFIQRLLEGVVAVGLVLVFFFVLIMVFNAMFPEGSGMQFIFSGQGKSDRIGGRQSPEIRVSRGAETDLLNGDDSWSASLVRTRNAVKSKKAGDIAWQPAQQGMKLGNLDAVQTFDSASALIRFDAENFIDLGANSLIVIRQMERDLLFKEKRSFMVVVDGELRGRVGGGDESGVYLEVATPNAVARLKSDPNDAEGIEFKINVLDDDASTITIYSGEGEVEAQGETVFLERNQVTRIDGEMVPTEPVTLPDAAVLLTPTTDTVFAYRSLPPRVKLSWIAQAEVKSYHLLLATDRDFTEILIDKELARPEFMHGNLRTGDYFWKVSATNHVGESAFSPPSRFTLRQDQSPPELVVNFPPPTVQRPEAEIRGRTEADARVFIAGNEVGPDQSGAFRYQLALKRGLNIVVVEAVDPAGNISYQSQIINGKY